MKITSDRPEKVLFNEPGRSTLKSSSWPQPPDLRLELASIVEVVCDFDGSEGMAGFTFKNKTFRFRTDRDSEVIIVFSDKSIDITKMDIQEDAYLNPMSKYTSTEDFLDFFFEALQKFAALFGISTITFLNVVAGSRTEKWCVERSIQEEGEREIGDGNTFEEMMLEN